MGILVYKDAAAACAAAATLFAAQIIEMPDSSLGFVTGSTPAGVYGRLVNMTASGMLDWSDIKTFNLSEYAGLPEGSPDSSLACMEELLFAKVGVKRRNIHVPKGDVKDLSASCAAYEDEIAAAGGIDLQLLCLGRNGSVGFNAPGKEFSPMTHAVALPESDPRAKPRYALTMGIGTIMNARRIVMLATGAEKAEAVARMLNSAVSPAAPATVLQLHRKVTYIMDEAAASRI